MNQNYGKEETNIKVMQSPASRRKKKALQFLGNLKLEIIKSAEFLDNIWSVRQCDNIIQYVSVRFINLATSCSRDQAIGFGIFKRFHPQPLI